MKELQSQRNDVSREFLPPRCSARKDLIMEIVGRMPYDTFEVFVLWYMDELSVSEISTATEIAKADVVRLIRRGQEEICRALELPAEAGAPAGTIPILTQAFNAYHDRHFVRGGLEDFIDRLCEGEGKKPREGGAVSPLAAEGSCAGKHAVNACRSVMFASEDGRRRYGGRRKSARAGAASATAAALFAAQAVVPLKVAAAVGASLILVVSGILAYHFTARQDQHSSFREDVIIQEKAPAQASPPKSVQNPDVSPAPEPVTTGASVDERVPRETEPEETETTRDLSIDPPPAREAAVEPLASRDSDPAEDEFWEALHQGDIQLYGTDCPCGHVNPISARAIHMKQNWGQVAWVILSGDGQTVLYEGKGVNVTDELASLYANQGDGAYYIEFTYTSRDGQTAVRSAPVRIDGGEIHEKQYG